MSIGRHRAVPAALREYLCDNAFCRLALEPSATRTQVERAARAQLDRLELELDANRRRGLGSHDEAAPFRGADPRARQIAAVREARHLLRNPRTRAEHELRWHLARHLGVVPGSMSDTAMASPDPSRSIS